MTSSGTDMSTPVTRGELREELAEFERKFDGKLDQLERKLERKFDNNLGLWGGALAAQIRELATQITGLESRMLNELARHTNAGFESMTKQISSVDEKYNDLPARVARVEVEVDALKQR
jgi:cell division protein FtsB